MLSYCICELWNDLFNLPQLQNHFILVWRSHFVCFFMLFNQHGWKLKQRKCDYVAESQPVQVNFWCSLKLQHQTESECVAGGGRGHLLYVIVSSDVMLISSLKMVIQMYEKPFYSRAPPILNTLCLAALLLFHIIAPFSSSHLIYSSLTRAHVVPYNRVSRSSRTKKYLLFSESIVFL